MSKPDYSPEPEDPEAFTQRVDEAYSRFAGAYNAALKVFPAWKKWLSSVLPHVQGPRVLEVSFGTGWLLTKLAATYETHGVDISARMVEVAQKNLDRCDAQAQLVRASVESMPFPDGHFNSVINTMAFSAYPNAGRALAEIRRVLHPEGRLLIVDVEYPTHRSWLSTKLVRLWQAGGDLVRPMGKLLDQAGFAYERQEVGGFGSVHLFVATRRGGDESDARATPPAADPADRRDKR